jgi:pyruvate formate lyase activating enzyme
MLRFALQKTSLIDFPGEVAAVLFTRGCNLRCPYCHNPELVTGPEPPDMLKPEEILAFLHSRKKVLDGVCISGGEPLLHPGLGDFIREVRGLGYKVKIDTNGTLPDILKILKVDYIALDIKTLPEKYAALLPEGCAAFSGAAEEKPPGESAGKKIAAAMRESLDYLIASGIDHELRSTAAPGIFLPEDVEELSRLIRGTRRYILTGMRPEKTLDPAYGKTRAPYPAETLDALRRAFRDRGIMCSVRGLN